MFYIEIIMTILFQIQRQKETLEAYKAKDVKQDIKDFNIKLNSIECVDFGHLSYMWYILHQLCEYSIKTLKTHSKYCSVLNMQTSHKHHVLQSHKHVLQNATM